MQTGIVTREHDLMDWRNRVRALKDAPKRDREEEGEKEKKERKVIFLSTRPFLFASESVLLHLLLLLLILFAAFHLCFVFAFTFWKSSMNRRRWIVGCVCVFVCLYVSFYSVSFERIFYA